MQKLVQFVEIAWAPWVGPVGILVSSFLDSSVLSLPQVGELLVAAVSAARPETAWLAVLLASSGSLAGCLVLWTVGRRGGTALLSRCIGGNRLEWAQNAFDRFGSLALGLAALLPPPVPFKVFVLGAGAFGMSLRRFAVVILVARGLRFGLWAFLGVRFGPRAGRLLGLATAWFVSRTPSVLAIVVALVVVVFSFALLRRRIRPEPPVEELPLV